MALEPEISGQVRSPFSTSKLTKRPATIPDVRVLAERLPLRGEKQPSRIVDKNVL